MDAGGGQEKPRHPYGNKITFGPKTKQQKQTMKAEPLNKEIYNKAKALGVEKITEYKT